MNARAMYLRNARCSVRAARVARLAGDDAAYGGQFDTAVDHWRRSVRHLERALEWRKQARHEQIGGAL